MAFLTKGDIKLQEVALECVVNFGSLVVKRYSEKLLHLVDKNKFKDEFLAFTLDKTFEQDRAELMPILIRVFYGRMIDRNESNAQGGQQGRRR